MSFRTLRLYYELASIHALLWLASTARRTEPTPETNLYLADVHFRLATDLQDRRKHVAARRHRNLANRYATLGPELDPKPAAAMAMPVPRAPVFTDARGTFVPSPKK